MLKDRVKERIRQIKKVIIGLGVLGATASAPSFVNPSSTTSNTDKSKEHIDLTKLTPSPMEQEKIIEGKVNHIMKSYLDVMCENISTMEGLQRGSAKYNKYKVNNLFKEVYTGLDASSKHCVAGAMKSMQDASESNPELKQFLETIGNYTPSWSSKDFKHALVSCPLFIDAIQKQYPEKDKEIIQEGRMVTDGNKAKSGYIDLNTLKPGDAILVHVGNASNSGSGKHYITYGGINEEGIHCFSAFNKEKVQEDLMSEYGKRRVTVIRISSVIEDYVRKAYTRDGFPANTYDATPNFMSEIKANPLSPLVAKTKSEIKRS